MYEEGCGVMCCCRKDVVGCCGCQKGVGDRGLYVAQSRTGDWRHIDVAVMRIVMGTNIVVTKK